MNSVVNILLVDDDKDDRFCFSKAISEIQMPTSLTTLNDGDRLITYLTESALHVPDVIFLDLNMPRKNGAECLLELKRHKKLKNIPVVIYSTSFHKEVLDLFRSQGAFCCIRKPSDPLKLRDILRATLTAIMDAENIQLPKVKFMLHY